MSYQTERDTFISQATREGLSVDVARKLLRYATTLQRLAECQCNGDWPYNGDRDRPAITFKPCESCRATGIVTPRLHGDDLNPCACPNHNGVRFDDCLDCQGTGKLQTNGKERMRHDSRYTTCPKCEASGVSKSAMRTSGELWNEEKTLANGITVAVRGKVCPDCRTQELVKKVLREASIDYWKRGDMATHELDNSPRKDYVFVAHFNGDPRGAVLVLSTPGYPWTEDGRGKGLYVPAGKGR